MFYRQHSTILIDNGTVSKQVLGGKKLRIMAVALMSAFRVREALVVVFPEESNVEHCKQ